MSTDPVQDAAQQPPSAVTADPQPQAQQAQAPAQAPAQPPAQPEDEAQVVQQVVQQAPPPQATAPAPQSHPGRAPPADGYQPHPMGHTYPRRNHRRAPHYLKKTRLCRGFEANGDCQYGEACWFAHGEGERREVNPNSFPRRAHPYAKTKMCKFVTSGGNCPYNDSCNFAHSQMELRPPQHVVMFTQPMEYSMMRKRPIDTTRYKTRLCKSFQMNGYCKFGDTCAFAHGRNELRNGAPFTAPTMYANDFQQQYYPDMNAQYTPPQQPYVFTNPPPPAQPPAMAPMMVGSNFA